MKSGNGSPTQKRLKLKVSERRVAEGVDRLSNLPEGVISCILSLLPTKNAVATSVLSKSWELRWTHVSSFDVDDKLWHNNRLWYRIQMAPKKDFAGFVKMVLHNQTADSPNLFRLLCNSRKRGKYSFLRNWRDQVKLPAELYISGNLQVLKLAGPFMLDLSNRVFLPKLLVLELNSVFYKSYDSVHKLISGCPALQSLAMKRSSRRDNLLVCTISSLTLKRLRIWFSDDLDDDYLSVKWAKKEMDETPDSVQSTLEIDAPALEYLFLKNIVPLEKFSITPVKEVDLEIYWRSSEDMVVRLVQSLDRVERLKLGKEVMEALSLATNKLSGNFKRLTKLVVAYNPAQHWSCLIDLIHHCVKLEVIEINIYSFESREETHDESVVRYWRDLVRVPTCLSLSLRQVTIRGFYDHQGLMAMLAYILDHGLVMERVNLSFHASYGSKKHSAYEEGSSDDDRSDSEERSSDDDRSDSEERSSDNERGSDDDHSDHEDDDSDGDGDGDGDGVCYEAKYPVLNKVLMLSRASPSCKIQDVDVSF